MFLWRSHQLSSKYISGFSRGKHYSRSPTAGSFYFTKQRVGCIETTTKKTHKLITTYYINLPCERTLQISIVYQLKTKRNKRVPHKTAQHATTNFQALTTQTNPILFVSLQMQVGTWDVVQFSTCCCRFGSFASNEEWGPNAADWVGSEERIRLVLLLFSCSNLLAVGDYSSFYHFTGDFVGLRRLRGFKDARLAPISYLFDPAASLSRFFCAM